MRPWIWGVPLIVLAAIAGIALGMRQAGAILPWPPSHPAPTLRTDIGSEARLGSPLVGAVPSGEVTTPAPGGSGTPGGQVPGDGEVVTLAGRGQAVLTGKSGVLMVTAVDGKELLHQSAEGLEGWWSWQAAGTTFLWLRYYASDGNRLNRVFRYDAGADLFQPVAWDDGATEHLGKLTFVPEGALLREEALIDAHHTQTRFWRYTGAGRLQSGGGAYHLADSQWYPADAGALLTAFFESVGLRLPEEARRYYADPRQADASYQVLVSQVLSYGQAHVLLGDALAPRREYPFFLDLEGNDPANEYYVLSLQGSVVVRGGQDGKRLLIDTLPYSVIPEPVDRGRAIALVMALPEVRVLPESGRNYRIAHGFAHWTVVLANSGPVFEVDSRTGEVYRIDQEGHKIKVGT